MTNKPKYYRESKGNRISWEIYSRHSFFITISIRRVEFQLNRWGKRDGKR